MNDYLVCRRSLGARDRGPTATRDSLACTPTTAGGIHRTICCADAASLSDDFLSDRTIARATIAAIARALVRGSKTADSRLGDLVQNRIDRFVDIVSARRTRRSRFGTTLNFGFGCSGVLRFSHQTNSGPTPRSADESKSRARCLSREPRDRPRHCRPAIAGRRSRPEQARPISR